MLHKCHWQKIKNSSQDFTLYHSDNDPYLPTSWGEEFASKLGIKPKIVKGAGHFNKDAGYDKFALLLEDIKIHLENINLLHKFKNN